MPSLPMQLVSAKRRAKRQAERITNLLQCMIIVAAKARIDRENLKGPAADSVLRDAETRIAQIDRLALQEHVEDERAKQAAKSGGDQARQKWIG